MSPIDDAAPRGARVRAIARHEIPERPPLRVAVGDAVVAVRRDTEWPAFVYVEAATGSGWVPSRYLSTDCGPAAVRHAYDTTELPVERGEVLVVVERDDESGWLWCRAASGRQGWVPTSCLADDARDAGSGKAI